MPGSPSDSLDFEALDLAEARAPLADALIGARKEYHDPESDTWPAGRPILDWLLRTMPEGGTGWASREDAADAFDAVDDPDSLDGLDSDEMTDRFIDAILEPHTDLVEGFAPVIDPPDSFDWMEFVLSHWARCTDHGGW